MPNEKEYGLLGLLLLVVAGGIAFAFPEVPRDIFKEVVFVDHFMITLVFALISIFGTCLVAMYLISRAINGMELLTKSGLKKTDVTLIRMLIVGLSLTGLGFLIQGDDSPSVIVALLWLLGLLVLMTPFGYGFCWLVSGSEWRKTDEDDKHG